MGLDSSKNKVECIIGKLQMCSTRLWKGVQCCFYWYRPIFKKPRWYPVFLWPLFFFSLSLPCSLLPCCADKCHRCHSSDKHHNQILTNVRALTNVTTLKKNRKGGPLWFCCISRKIIMGNRLWSKNQKKYITIPFMIFSGESNDYIKIPLISFCYEVKNHNGFSLWVFLERKDIL